MKYQDLDLYHPSRNSKSLKKKCKLKLQKISLHINSGFLLYVHKNMMTKPRDVHNPLSHSIAAIMESSRSFQILKIIFLKKCDASGTMNINVDDKQ